MFTRADMSKAIGGNAVYQWERDGQNPNDPNCLKLVITPAGITVYLSGPPVQIRSDSQITDIKRTFAKAWLIHRGLNGRGSQGEPLDEETAERIITEIEQGADEISPTAYQKKAARTLIDGQGYQIQPDHFDVIIETVAAGVALSASQEYAKKGILHRHGFTFYKFKGFLSRARQAVNNLGALGDGSALYRNLLIECRSDPPKMMILWNILGLMGEAGELGALILNYIRTGEMDRQKFVSELGDCVWYLTAICTKLNISLGEVMEANIAKLEARYNGAGFSSEASMKRVDVK